MLPNVLKLITTLLALVGLGTVYFKGVRPLLHARKERRLASNRYIDLFGTPDGTCYVCRKEGSTCYDKYTKRWYHAACMKSLIP